MNTPVVGLIIAVALIFVLKFPADAASFIENVGAIVGEMWVALREVVREIA